MSHDEINLATESETIKSGNNVFIKRHFQKIGPALIVILSFCAVIAVYVIGLHNQTIQGNAATSSLTNSSLTDWVINVNQSKVLTENDISDLRVLYAQSKKDTSIMNECLSQNITGGADYEKASNDFISINAYVVNHYTDYSLAPFNDSNSDIKMNSELYNIRYRLITLYCTGLSFSLVPFLPNLV